MPLKYSSDFRHDERRLAEVAYLGFKVAERLAIVRVVMVVRRQAGIGCPHGGLGIGVAPDCEKHPLVGFCTHKRHFWLRQPAIWVFCADGNLWQPT